MPEGRPGQVEAGDDVVRPDVLEAAQDDAPEAEHRVDELALARRQRRVHEREIGAIDQAVGVQEHQPLHGWECTGEAVLGRLGRCAAVASAGSAEIGVGVPAAGVDDQDEEARGR